MATIAYIELNMFAASVLLVILFNLRRNRAELLFDEQSAFIYMVLCNLLLVLMDMLAWVMDRRAGTFALYANYIANFLLYFFGAFIGPCYLFYCDCKLNIPKDVLKKRLRRYGLCVLVIELGLLVNLFCPVYFSVDSANVYSRGPFLWVELGQVYLCLLYGSVRLLRRYFAYAGSRKEKRMLLSLFFFVLPPLIASCLQLRFYGLTTTWQSSAISMLVIYLNVQNNEMRTDTLTGLLNRRELTPYLERLMERNRTNGRCICLIMGDIDDFKSINDRLGHAVGDEILIAAARILRQNTDAEDFVARYGGDEFVIVAACEKRQQGEARMRRIHNACNAYNRRYGAQCELHMSLGMTVWDRELHKNAEGLIHAADEMMYAAKRKKKAV